VLCLETFDFLGLTFSKNGVLTIQPNVLEKVSAFPNKISDRKQLQRFLGCINYISKQGFSSINLWYMAGVCFNPMDKTFHS